MADRPMPRFRRRVAPFTSLFDTDAESAIAAMDAAGDDLVGAVPDIRIPVEQVGCERRDVVVFVRDPFGTDAFVPAVCRIAVATRLPAERRGIHMSRLGALVACAAGGTYPDFSGLARRLAQDVRASQYGGRTRVTVAGRLQYLEDVAATAAPPLKPSLEHLDLQATVEIDEGSIVTQAFGLTTHCLVACPCVQKTLHHAVGPARRAAEGAPYLTHSQRCVLTLEASGVSATPGVPALLAVLDERLVRTLNTLPRPMELALVFQAHRRPQFIEDAVRAAAVSLSVALAGVTRFDEIVVTGRSLESIHEFDLSAACRLTEVEAASIDRDRPRVL
jgi:GTP cyclohydrolase FolE2